MHTMCTYSPISPLRTPEVKDLRQAVRPQSPKKPTSHLDPSSTSHREIMRPEYSMREAATPHLGCVVPVVPRIGCVFRGDCMNYFGRLQTLVVGPAKTKTQKRLFGWSNQANLSKRILCVLRTRILFSASLPHCVFIDNGLLL